MLTVFLLLSIMTHYFPKVEDAVFDRGVANIAWVAFIRGVVLITFKVLRYLKLYCLTWISSQTGSAGTVPYRL